MSNMGGLHEIAELQKKVESLRSQLAASEKSRKEVWRPFDVPTETAMEVFRTAKESDASLDMRPIPNGWLIKERTLSAEMAAIAEAATQESESLHTRVEQLEAENANLRALAQGQTAFHSDEAVNKEMGRLRARVGELELALKEIASNKEIPSIYSEFSPPWKYDSLKRRQIAIKALTSSPSAVAEVLRAAREQARIGLQPMTGNGVDYLFACINTNEAFRKMEEGK